MHNAVDHALLSRTARGDDAAARMLWSVIGPRLVALARGMLRYYGGEAAAMDVVQTVLCRVVGSDRSVIADVDDVAAWLSRGVRNECLNYRRTIDRRDARESVVRDSTVRDSLNPGHTPDPADSFAQLNDALGKLPENLREILLLKHAAGLTFDQMALSLHENRSTIATRYSKALKLLREATDEKPQAASQPHPTREVHT